MKQHDLASTPSSGSTPSIISNKGSLFAKRQLACTVAPDHGQIYGHAGLCLPRNFPMQEPAVDASIGEAVMRIDAKGHQPTSKKYLVFMSSILVSLFALLPLLPPQSPPVPSNFACMVKIITRRAHPDNNSDPDKTTWPRPTVQRILCDACEQLS
ncbi:hypothetical protein BD289DRAFT_154051 [Coniella lustricola]|uniref:Uncharacterized protein n=1 Tax=Coniella lustricola TaxID=2025994 RepID=A0A2T3AMJ7_9PEZI|nr:hypothetical protein BD289DRAFT_154051 [Coniella lustricola]